MAFLTFASTVTRSAVNVRRVGVVQGIVGLATLAVIGTAAAVLPHDDRHAGSQGGGTAITAIWLSIHGAGSTMPPARHTVIPPPLTRKGIAPARADQNVASIRVTCDP